MRFLIGIVLIVATLVSQTGMPLWTHLCKGEVEGVSWLLPAESCHETHVPKSCHADAGASKSSCCTKALVEQDEDRSCCEDDLQWDTADDELFVYTTAEKLPQSVVAISLPAFAKTHRVLHYAPSRIVRPPPEAPPLSNSMRCAMLQVYRC